MLHSRKILLLFLLLPALLSTCKKAVTHPDYRSEMRTFVERISAAGKAMKPGFIVIPQNGLELLSSDGTPAGNAETEYLQAIDGVGQEELFYGYDNHDDMQTPGPDHAQLLGMCRFARDHGKKVLVTDYCSTPGKISDSYSQNNAEHFISFAATHRDLDNIPSPSPFYPDSTGIDSLSSARNFLYLIDPSAFATKDDFIRAVAQTDYDVVVMDLFFDGNDAFTAADLARLRTKASGATRKLVCYMSIGEAENYRWYWKPFWYATPPPFLVADDPQWAGNYIVRYWDPSWQQIICGANDSYLRKAVDAGFDGVYLDIIDAYEFFEQ